MNSAVNVHENGPQLFLVYCRPSDISSKVRIYPSATSLGSNEGVHIEVNKQATLNISQGFPERIQVAVKQPAIFAINDAAIFTFDEESKDDVERALNFDNSEPRESCTAQFGPHDKLSLDGDLGLRCLETSSQSQLDMLTRHFAENQTTERGEVDATVRKALQEYRGSLTNCLQSVVHSQIEPLTEKIQLLESKIDQNCTKIDFIATRIHNKENISPNIDRASAKNSKQACLISIEPSIEDLCKRNKKILKTEASSLASSPDQVERGNVAARKKKTVMPISKSARSAKMSLITPFKVTNTKLNDSKDLLVKQELRSFSRTKCSKRLQTILKKIDKMKPSVLRTPDAYQSYLMQNSHKMPYDTQSSREHCRVPKGDANPRLKTLKEVQATAKAKKSSCIFRAIRKLSLQSKETPRCTNNTLETAIQSTNRQLRAIFFNGNRSVEDKPQ